MTYFTYNYLTRTVLATALEKPVKVNPDCENCLPELQPISDLTFVQWLSLLNDAIEAHKLADVDQLHEDFPTFFDAWSDAVQSAYLAAENEKNL